MWEERDCPVCGLYDSRRQNPERERHLVPHGNWKVTTPCIEPVPERVTFEAFIADLTAHDIDILNPKRSIAPHAMGHPGNWRVGFKRYLQNDEVRLDPAIEIKAPLDLEHGWAALLRWLRARHYDMYTHRNYESTNVHGLTVSHPRDSFDDD